MMHTTTKKIGTYNTVVHKCDRIVPNEEKIDQGIDGIKTNIIN